MPSTLSILSVSILMTPRLLANSSRGVMRIDTDKIESVEGIVAPVADGVSKGLTYETIATLKGIDQLDRFDSTHIIVLRRADGGSLNLESLPLP